MVFPVVFLEISFYTIQAAVLKGQTKPKADCCTVNSPNKEQTNLFCLLFLLFTANKSNSLVRFLGESTARQSCFRFQLTFKSMQISLLIYNIFAYISLTLMCVLNFLSYKKCKTFFNMQQFTKSHKVLHDMHNIKICISNFRNRF